MSGDEKLPFHKGQRVKLRPVQFHAGQPAVLVDNCEFGTVEDPGMTWTWVLLDSGTLWRFHAENIERAPNADAELNEIRVTCPECGHEGPHEIGLTDTAEVLVGCGECGHGYMAEPDHSRPIKDNRYKPV